MPRSDQLGRGLRVRKHTPMVMPRTQPDKLLSHQSTESIAEEEAECSTDQSDHSDQSAPSINNEDGTFVIPKLNKVEVGPRQEFKSKAIKVDLKHHSFESKPLETSLEPSSNVVLGRALSTVTSTNENDRKQRKKRVSKTRKETALALIDEIIHEVDRRYLFVNVFYHCSFSTRLNLHIICLYNHYILYHVSIPTVLASNYNFLAGSQRGTQRCKT